MKLSASIRAGRTGLPNFKKYKPPVKRKEKINHYVEKKHMKGLRP